MAFVEKPDHSEGEGIPPADDWSGYIEGWKARIRREEEQLAHWLVAARQDAERLARLLADQYRVRAVYLFGSVLTGNVHAGSDLDLAVDGLAPDQFFSAWAHLERETELAVDLVDLNVAPTSLVERVRRDGRLLYGWNE